MGLSHIGLYEHTCGFLVGFPMVSIADAQAPWNPSRPPLPAGSRAFWGHDSQGYLFPKGPKFQNMEYICMYIYIHVYMYGFCIRNRKFGFGYMLHIWVLEPLQVLWRPQ